MKPSNDIYERYEKMCMARNLSNYQISQKTGISQATLSGWKHGNFTPKADKLQLIADCLHVSIDYLMTGKEGEKNDVLDRDVKKKFDEISDLLKSGEMAPLYFDGKPADNESIDLLLKQVEFSLAFIQQKNKKGEK